MQLRLRERRGQRAGSVEREVNDKIISRTGSISVRHNHTNKIMKKILITFATVCLLAFGSQAQLQPFNGVGGTNRIVALSTNTTPSAIVRCDQGSTVAIQTILRQSSGATGTSNITFYFDRSLDAVTWDKSFVSNVVASSTTAYVTNFATITVGAFPWLRIGDLWNISSNAFLTNFSVHAFPKPGF